MTAADLLSERASALARSDSRDADAITELLMMADGHRVSVVRARQQLATEFEGEDTGGDVNHAMELLQAVIDQMPV